MTKYELYKSKCYGNGITIGEAYKIAHEIWDEKNPEDMKDLAEVQDPNLHYLYNH